MTDAADKRNDAPSPAARDEANYARLLAEARQIHGVSLSRDAWRRLKRNKASITALMFLAWLGIAAFLTPLWPLQAPRSVHTERAYFGPLVSPLFTHTAAWVDDAGRVDDDAVAAAFGIRAPHDPKVGWFDVFNRGLVHARAAVFGRWEANSWCGCDTLGRDLLARLFWGARISLIVGLVAALVSLVIGVSYGAISGYLGGNIDSLMMRVVDVLYSIPFIFVVILLITVLDDPTILRGLRASYGEGHLIPTLYEAVAENRIMTFFVVVGAIYWLTMARVVRGQVLSLKQEQFVEAARTIGAGRPRIIFLHLVPNLLSIIIVYLTLTIPRVMLFEAFLSFLGLGVQAPDVSWGVLASEGTASITPINIIWWMVVFPGLALATTLFALNTLGDGLRDALDPRLKNR